MKLFTVAVSSVVLMTTGAGHAASTRQQQMLKLSPETRVEQRCDARAMGAVQREHKGYRPDEFVAYAFADPVLRGSKISAPGGAIRSNGKWYRLSYTCKTGAKHIEIKDFDYRIGSMVPRSAWTEHYLYD